MYGHQHTLMRQDVVVIGFLMLSPEAATGEQAAREVRAVPEARQEVPARPSDRYGAAWWVGCLASNRADRWIEQVNSRDAELAVSGRRWHSGG